MGERLPMQIPNGKHTKETAASTENHTVSRCVLFWSKKPIRGYAVARLLCWPKVPLEEQVPAWCNTVT